MANPFKFRADHSGALIVPEELKKAREDFAAGNIDESALHEIEEQCVAQVLKMQSKAVFDVFSDGELLRDDYEAELKAALENGVDAAVAEVEKQAATLKREVGILKRNIKTTGTSYNYKLSVYTPGQLIGLAYRTLDGDEAKTVAKELAEKVIPIVKSELNFLLAEKVTYIQLVNRNYGHLLATSNHAELKDKGLNPDTILDEIMAADMAVLDGLDRSGDTIIGQSVCKGAKEPWFRSEGHEAFAEKLFANLPVDRFNVIFGSAGDLQESDFQSLRFIPEDTVLSVGLLDASKTELEDTDEVLDRLDEVDEVHGQPELSVSIQGSFRAHGDEDAQFKKLQKGAQLARQYWGFEM